MASTNKTSNLRLNNWIESDCPKRIDFVSDNLIIDNVLGTHIGDEDIHLTPSEKSRVSAPYLITLNQGNGNSSGVYDPGFDPKIAFIFKVSTPFQTESSGNTVMNSAIVTHKGTTGGASLLNGVLTVRQSTSPENGVLYNLNENGANYVIIYFR